MVVRYVRCMHLRRAVTVQGAIEVIEERISTALQPLNAAADDADLKRHPYLNWVADTEARLQEIFSDAGIEDPILGRGYWHICSASSSDEKLMNRLVREELRFQAGSPGIHGDSGGRLGEVRERLRALIQLGERPGICASQTPTPAPLHPVRPAPVGRARACRTGPANHPHRRDR